MLHKFKIVPLAFLLTTGCGDQTLFTETELGRFAVSAASSNDPSADGSVPLEQILAGPESESPSQSEPNDSTQNSAIVSAALAEADSSMDGSKDGGSSGNGPKAHPSASGEVSDEQTLKMCASLFQGRAKYIKLIRSTDASASLSTHSDTVLAIRLSGNQSKLSLNIGGNEKVAGLCIVATGNKPVTELSSSVAMGQIVYVARGNSSQARFAFTGEALDSAFVDLKGNSHAVGLQGVGTRICSSLAKSQGSSTVDCE